MQRSVASAARSVSCVLAALLALAFLVPLHAAQRYDAPTDAAEFWKGDRDRWVHLEPQDPRDAAPNEHPVQIDSAAIQAVLASVWIGEGESAEPVFTPDESEVFAVHIAAALAQARPDQDVTFRATGTRRSAAGKVLKGTRVNTGRIFQADGKLNLILGEVHGQNKKRNVYGQWDEDFYEARPSGRASSEPHDWRVAATPGVEFKTMPDGTVRDDWLVFGPQQIAALSAAPAAPAVPATAAPAPAPAAPAPAATAPAPAVAPATPPPTSLSPEADMERRLRTLKDLHDKGLITDEVYRAKVEEILSVL
jgi:hypothetical protein